MVAADDEFFISPTASNLINSAFGWATVLAADQLQGGPVYPLATPAPVFSSSRPKSSGS